MAKLALPFGLSELFRLKALRTHCLQAPQLKRQKSKRLASGEETLVKLI